MKILFFSPYSYFTIHSIPENIVAQALRNNGHEIISVGCNGIYSDYCLCMTPTLKYNSSKCEKNKICNECKFSREKITDNFSFKFINIDEYINIEDVDFINLEVKNLTKGDIISYNFKNIPVAKYSLYEFLLNRKLNNIDLNDEEWSEFLIHFKNSLYTCIAGYKIMELINPDRILTYNSNYSVNHIICSIAESYNILHYSLHAGAHLKYRLSSISIFKGYLATYSWNTNKFWFDYSKNQLRQESIKNVNEHINILLNAKSPWVYSRRSQKKSEIDLKLNFGININQKVLVATMSSEDERFAAEIIGNAPKIESQIFQTNYDWIIYLIDLIKNEKDLFLIIRVHPREFPNKRENVLSRQAFKLNSLFNNLPNNVYINFPSDNISLHDLIKITDVCLNSTSTSGLEFLLFGIPVVIYDKNILFSYARELNLVSESINDYKDKIFDALRIGPTLKNIILAYRWLSYKNEYTSIDISDIYKPITYPNLVFKIFKILQKFYLKTRLDYLFLTSITKKAINHNYLTIAIENGLENHLKKINIDLTNDFTNQNEIFLVKRSVMNNLKKITNKKNDPIFHQKIQNIFKNK